MLRSVLRKKGIEREQLRGERREKRGEKRKKRERRKRRERIRDERMTPVFEFRCTAKCLPTTLNKLIIV